MVLGKHGNMLILDDGNICSLVEAALADLDEAAYLGLIDEEDMACLRADF
jgi:hypothetical protein